MGLPILCTPVYINCTPLSRIQHSNHQGHSVPHIRSSLVSASNSYHLLRQWPNKTPFYCSWVQWLKAMGPETVELGVSEAFTLWSRIGIWEQKLVCSAGHFLACYSAGLHLYVSRDIKSFCRFNVTPVHSEVSVWATSKRWDIFQVAFVHYGKILRMQLLNP